MSLMILSVAPIISLRRLESAVLDPSFKLNMPARGFRAAYSETRKDGRSSSFVSKLFATLISSSKLRNAIAGGGGCWADAVAG